MIRRRRAPLYVVAWKYHLPTHHDLGDLLMLLDFRRSFKRLLCALRNTLIYVLINLRALARVQAAAAEERAALKA